MSMLTARLIDQSGNTICLPGGEPLEVIVDSVTQRFDLVGYQTDGIGTYHFVRLYTEGPHVWFVLSKVYS